MAYRELHVIEAKEILRLWQRGLGLRTIATRLRVDRKTVRRYVDAAKTLGLTRNPEQNPIEDDLLAVVFANIRSGGSRQSGAMRQHCRDHSELIEKWIQDGCRGPKIRKLLARHSGVIVPLRTLQRFLRDDMSVNSKGDTVRITDPPPGQCIEIDFLELGFFKERGSGRRRKMLALLCTAPNSRHQFLYPTLSQTTDDLIEALEAAWRFFGGIFPVAIIDNTRAAIKKADPIDAIINATFLEYAQTRDFEVDPARVRKPRDKARVERQVSYVRDDFFRGESFGSVEEARTAAEFWCRNDAGGRIHGTTRRRPLEAFEQDELPLLKPAPIAPYDAPRWFDLHVGRDHAVVVNHALYSVPFAYRDVELRVRLDLSTVKLFHKGILIKLHPRQVVGGANIDPEDLPPGKAELATRDGASLILQAESYGPAVAEYARRLLDGPLPWTRLRRVYRLLGLARRFGGPDTNEACRRALELDVVDVKRIDRILERGLIRRGVLAPVRPAPPRGQVLPLRFSRDPAEYRVRRPPGEPDAPA